MIRVKEIMTSDLFTMDANVSLSEVHQLMAGKNIRHVPIVKEGELLGIVSHRDLMAATPIANENKLGAYSKTNAGDIMRTGVETVMPESSARIAALTLGSLKIGCLPVLSHGELVGIITSSDFVATAADLMLQAEQNVIAV